MADVILVLNAGSSSIKFCVFDAGRRRARAVAARPDRRPVHRAALRRDRRGGHEIGEQTWDEGADVGHERRARRTSSSSCASTAADTRSIARRPSGRAWRPTFTRAGARRRRRCIADARQAGAARAAAPAAQPGADPRSSPSARPELPQVACFDTAFHRSQPEVAQAFALPPTITERGVRRYGFHGLSYEYIAERAAASSTPNAAAGRTVVAHLGNGAQHVRDAGGQSIASTMGFTAVDGLPMGTRCGTLDPGVILYLMDELRHGCARDREPDLQAVRPARRVGHFERHARRCSRATIRARASRSICSSTASGANSARWRRRWAASTRWSSPRASASTRRRSASACAATPAWLGVELDAAANEARRAAHQHGGEQGVGLGDPDQRRTDDRAPHPSGSLGGLRPPAGGPGPRCPARGVRHVVNGLRCPPAGGVRA